MRLFTLIPYFVGTLGTALLPAQPVSSPFPELKYNQTAELGFRDFPSTTTGFIQLGQLLGHFEFSRLSDLDSPRSIVAQVGAILPTMTIRQKRVPLSERDLLTEYGRLETAKIKYLSPLYRAVGGPLSQLATYYFSPLSIFSGWHPNDAEAMTLYLQEERLEMLSEMDRLISLETAQKPEEIKELKKMRMRQSISSRGVFFTPSTTHP